MAPLSQGRPSLSSSRRSANASGQASSSASVYGSGSLAGSIGGVANNRRITCSLPPPLGKDCLTSLARIATPAGDAPLQWRKYTGSTNELETAQERLCHLSTEELRTSRQRKLNHDAEADTALDKIVTGILWAPEYVASETSIHALWLFDFDGGYEEERKGDKAGPDLKDLLCSTSGSVHLSELYDTLSWTSIASPDILRPKQTNDLAQVQRLFLHAIEEKVLSRWVTVRAQEIHSHQTTSNKEDSTPLPFPPTGEEQDGLEKEKVSYYWGGGRHQRRAFRMGRSILLPPRTSHQDSIRLGLRASLDDVGQLFVTTWPMAGARLRPVIQSSTARPGTPVVLSPHAGEARLVSWVGKLVDEVSNGETAATSSLKQARSDLLARIGDRGVDVESLSGDWILCETDDDNGQEEGESQVNARQFLWPADLVFARQETVPPSLAPRRRKMQPHGSMEVVSMCTTELAQRTVDMMRGVPLETTAKVAKSESEVDPTAERRQSNSTSEGEDFEVGDSSLERADEEEEEKEEASSDNDAIVEKEEEEGSPDNDGDVTMQPMKTAEEDVKEEEVAMTPKAEPTSEKASVVENKSVEDGDAGNGAPSPSKSSKQDVEMDLWGDFAFEGDSGKRQESASPANETTQDDDDGMFGLVTEDDFSFFDDAAAAAAAAASTSIDEQPRATSPLTYGDEDQLQFTEVDDEGGHQHQGEDEIVMVPTATTDRSARSHGNSVGSYSTSTILDHPSVPGFTPSSLSASSPAGHGAHIAKTPRTPYSPTQDMADAHITIEGENQDSDAYRHSARFAVSGGVLPPTSSGYGAIGDDGTGEEGGSAYAEATTNGTPLSLQESEGKAQRASSPRRKTFDLGSKYELGKYAITQRSFRRRASRKGPLAGARSKPLVGNTGKRHFMNRRGAAAAAVMVAAGQGDETMADGEGLTPATVSGSSSFLAEDSELDSSRRSELGEETHDDEGNQYDVDAFGEGDSEDDEDDDDASSGSDEDTDTSVDSLLQAENLAQERHAQLKNALAVTQASKCERRETDKAKAKANIDEEGAEGGVWPEAATLDVLVSWATDINHFRDAIVTFFPNGDEAEPPCLDARDNFELLTPMLNEAPNACSLNSVFKEVRVLEAPRLLVGCQDFVTSIAPTALPFWDKLSLSPVSGPKHITAFALQVADASEGWAREVRSYFERMQHAFASSRLGSHELADDGILGIGFPGESTISEALAAIRSSTDQWDDSMDSLMSRFEAYLKMGKTIVVYVVGEPSSVPPFWAMVLLETSLQARVKERLGLPVQRLLIKPLLWRWTSSSGVSLSTTVGQQASSAPGSGRLSFNVSNQARSIYDSVQVSVVPRVNEESFLPQLPSHEGIPVRFPHLTLAPSAVRLSKSSTNAGVASSEHPFKLCWPTAYVDVVHRSVFLHVGYRIAETDRELTIVTIMDELGQGYDVKAWPGGRSLEEEISDIWSFARQFARKAIVGWKMAICRGGCGSLTFEEVQVWSRLLSNPTSFNGLEHVIDVSLACSTDEPSLAILPPKSMPRRRQTEIPTSQEGRAKHSIDASRVSYALFPASRMAISSTLRDNDDQLLALRSSLIVTLFQQTNMSTSIAQTDCLFHSELCPHLLWTHLLQVYVNPLSSSSPNDAEAQTDGEVESNLDDRMYRLTSSFHDLESIARHRHQILEGGQHLPWHLAMLTLLSHGAAIFRR